MEFVSLTESRSTRSWKATRPCEMLLVSLSERNEHGPLLQPNEMTSDHRVAGSSPARCMPQYQSLIKDYARLGIPLLSRFLATFELLKTSLCGTSKRQFGTLPSSQSSCHSADHQSGQFNLPSGQDPAWP